MQARFVFFCVVSTLFLSVGPAFADSNNGNGSAYSAKSSTSTTTSSPTSSTARGNSQSGSNNANQNRSALIGNQNSQTTIPNLTSNQNSNGKSENSSAKSNSSPGVNAANNSGAKESKGKGSKSVEEPTDESLESDKGSNRYIVQFVKSANASETGKSLINDFNLKTKLQNVNAKNGSSKVNAGSQNSISARGKFITSFEKVLNAAVIEVPESALLGIQRNPRVLNIEKDIEVLVDPSISTQIGATWGIDRIDQRNLPLSGTFSTSAYGSGVSVYVVDTGIDAAHAEFAGRISSGFDAINGTDGRTDCNGHGTHVAGTIASATYGIAKSANLVPVKVLACDGSGSTAGVIAGLDWIVKNRPATQKAIANMSLGGGVSSSLDSAVSSVIASGVLVVVAAGNSNVDACTASPARVAAALTVGATTSADDRSSFSNYGPCVDVFAPGSNIQSTIPGGGTAVYSGTSMASPHVAGIAASILGSQTLSPTDLVVFIRETASRDVLTNLAAGSPNLLAYLDPAGGNQPPPGGVFATVPDAPDAPTVTAQSKAIVVKWALPDNGGSVLTAQRIRIYVGGSVVGQIQVDGTTTIIRVNKLRRSTEYRFSLQAINAIGTGTESALSIGIRPLR